MISPELRSAARADADGLSSRRWVRALMRENSAATKNADRAMMAIVAIVVAKGFIGRSLLPRCRAGLILVRAGST